ncbi:hypothetical protein HYS94_01065 [Candidatus Daviesbacteria bacterium]|nr:hypothetical protein [Candidatus Daviesbacteria bacterium]
MAIPIESFFDEITRKELTAYGELVELAKRLNRVHLDWTTSFELPDQELSLKDDVGPKTLHDLRRFQKDITSLIEERHQAPTSPYLIELIPSEILISPKGRRPMFFNHTPIVFPDPAVNAWIDACFREHRTGESILGLTVPSFAQLERDVTFLNQFSAGLRLRTHPMKLDIPANAIIRIIGYSDNIRRLDAA